MQIFASRLLFASIAAANLVYAQSGSGLSVQSEITGAATAGRFTLTHTVWNASSAAVTNAWLTNQFPSGVSFHATNKWPSGSPGPTYPEPPAPPLLLTPLAPGVTFGAPFTATNPPAVAIAIGDLNGDGWPDLVAAHGTNANGFSVWNHACTDDGSSPNPPLTAGGTFADSPVRAINLGDFNGDGRPDVVVAEMGRGSIRTYFQTGDIPSQEQFVLGTSNGFSSPITAIVVEDFDGDGLDDLIVLEPGANALHLLRNTANSGLAGFEAIGVRPTPPSPTALARERKFHGRESPTRASLSRLFVTGGSGNVTVYPPSADYDPATLYLPGGEYPCGPTPRAIEVADLDGDGLQDVVVANGPARTVTLLRGDDHGGYASAGAMDCGGAESVAALRLLDLDGNGRPELLAFTINQCIVFPNSRSADPLSTDQFGPLVQFDLPARVGSVGFDAFPDGRQAGEFVVIGHAGPSQGSLPGGQSFSVLGLIQPGAVLAVPLGDLAAGQATGVSVEIETRVPNATLFVRAAGNGGTAVSSETLRDLRNEVCGQLICVSGGLTQGLGGFQVNLAINGPNYNFTNTVTTAANGGFCTPFPFECGNGFYLHTITIWTPACPSQVWTFPATVLYTSLTFPTLVCTNCAACTNVQNVLHLFSGVGVPGLLPIGSLDPQFATGNPPFAGASPFVTAPPGSGIANGPNSQWVGPDLSLQSAGGVYCYTNQFYMPCTNNARLLGQWTMAGDGATVMLNGLPTGNTLIGPGAEATWFPLSLGGGFVPGLNTLVFCVTNSPGSSGLPTSPTGLRVELTGTALCCAGCIEITCPTNMVVEICTNGTPPFGQVVNYPAPSALSHCGVVTNVVTVPPSGSWFPLGTNTVTCIAYDSAGNVATCSFKVVVAPDFTPPTVIQCPPLNVSVSGCPPILPDFTTNVVAFDNCTPPNQLSITQSLPPGTPLLAGQTTLIVTTCDGAGNCVPCDVIVTATPTGTNPTIFCPTNLIFLTCSNTAVANFSVSAVNYTGTIACSPPSGSSFPLGTTWVTCTATNSCGGVATCQFPIIVKRPSWKWGCLKIGIGFPFDPVGGAGIGFSSRSSGGGAPTLEVIPAPGTASSGLLLQPGEAETISFAVELDFAAPAGAGFDLALPPDPVNPGVPPLLSFRSQGPNQGYIGSVCKGKDVVVTKMYAVSTNGDLLDPLTFTGDEVQTNTVLGILPMGGATNCHLTVELNLRNGGVSLEFVGPVEPSARHKGWDGCIYGPDRPVKKPPKTSRVVLIPPVAPTAPPIADLYLFAVGGSPLPIKEPTLSARNPRDKAWDGHVTLMKAYEDGAERGILLRTAVPGGGAHLELGYSAGFELGFRRLETNPPPVEEYVFRIGGPKWPPGTTTNRPPPPPIDVRLVSSTHGPGVECYVDFHTLEMTNVTVQLWTNGVLYAQGVGLANELATNAVVVSDWPERLRLVDVQQGLRFTSSKPFFVDGFGADELRIFPGVSPDAVLAQAFTELEFQANEDVDVFLHSLKTTSASIPSPLHIGVGHDGVNVLWSGDGLRLQGADNLDGPWFDLGVESPASLGRTGGSRFFRLLSE